MLEARGVFAGPLYGPLHVVVDMTRPGWSLARRPVLWTVGLVWISLLVFILALTVGLSHNSGELGPNVLIGRPNQFLIVAYSAWLMAAAWCGSVEQAKTVAEEG